MGALGIAYPPIVIPAKAPIRGAAQRAIAAATAPPSLQQRQVFGALGGQAPEAAQQVGELGAGDVLQAGDDLVVVGAQLVAGLDGGGQVGGLGRLGESCRPDCISKNGR